MTYLRPSPAVVAQKTRDGICLLHTTRSEYHLLNESAAVIWSLLEATNEGNDGEGVSLDDLAGEMSVTYGLDYETAHRDVKAFLSTAMAAGVIVTE